MAAAAVRLWHGFFGADLAFAQGVLDTDTCAAFTELWTAARCEEHSSMVSVLVVSAFALQNPLLAPRANAIMTTAPGGAIASRTRPVVAAANKPVPKAAIFYSTYAAGFTALLIRTLRAFPLVPPEPSSLAWNAAWLFTTVVDYYGAALALCGIILASEKRRVGILWSLGCLLLGTPFCCFYDTSRLLRNGTLRLAD